MLSRLRPDNDDQAPNRLPRRVAPVVTDVPIRPNFGSGPSERSRRGQIEPGPASRKRKRRPGNSALREIRRLQASTDLLIPKLAFARVVKDICSLIIPDINK